MAAETSTKVTKTILIGSDHAGFELKNALRDFLIEKGIKVNDMGPALFREDDDYPMTLEPLLQRITHQPTVYVGIVIGGSGQGEAIVANRHSHIRATTYYAHNLEIIRLSRQHNDANVLSLGARFLTIEQAKEAVLLWLQTSFSEDERHRRRITEIESVKVVE